MDHLIFDKWASLPGKAETVLLSAPFTFPPAPSIALSVFKSCLTEAGISSIVLYPVFPLIHALGMESASELSDFAPAKCVNEFLFAHLTDVNNEFDEQNFVEEVFREGSEEWRGQFAKRLAGYRRKAAQCVDMTARRVVSMGAKVVAASSIYSQQNASLAVFRRVKELDPGIKTIIGGFNVSGDMGACVLRNYPSVDYVFFGDGDEVFAEVVRAAEAGGPMPYGILGREDLADTTGELPFRLTKEMDTVPMPDYSDFFDEIARERDCFYGECLLSSSPDKEETSSPEKEGSAPPDKEENAPPDKEETSPPAKEETAPPAKEESEGRFPHGFERIIFLEGSRGCSWGQKQACSFCSINGLRNVYREKTPAVLYEEINRILDRWPGATIQLSDNMLGPAMRRELLPMLKADGRSRSMFAEVLSTLKEEDLRALGQAGFFRVQPGTESLNDHLLQLLGKGSTAVHNVAFLKYARTWGVTPLWNMLFGIPGEEEKDYEEMIQLLPLLSHLQPPVGFSSIAFVRFSRYWRDPESFGLELSPHPCNRYIWGDDPDRMKNMSVYYRVTGGRFRQVTEHNKPLYQQLDLTVEEWINLREQKHADLRMTRSPERISILDTRPCAVQLFTRLEGIHRELYSMAWNPLSPETARRALSAKYTPAEVDAAAQELIGHRIMIRLSGLYLALAVPWNSGAGPAPPEP